MYTKTYLVDNVEYIVFAKMIHGWKHVFFYQKSLEIKNKKLLLTDMGKHIEYL